MNENTKLTLKIFIGCFVAFSLLLYKNRKEKFGKFWLMKVYYWTCVIITFGLIPGILLILKPSLFLFSEISVKVTIIVASLWSLFLFLLIPTGVIILGIKSIAEKETAITLLVSPRIVKGQMAIFIGLIYLGLGLLLVYGLLGIFISFICDNKEFCISLPKYIRFF